MGKEKTEFLKGSEINAFALVSILFVLLTGCAEYQVAKLDVFKTKRESVKLTEVDFRPIEGNWQMDRGAQQAFEVRVKIEPGAPEDFSLIFYIKDNQLQRDPTLGFFPVHFISGQTVSSWPAVFTLKCTENGELRSMFGFGAGNFPTATIYLEPANLIVNQDFHNWTIYNEASRVEHTVTCGSISSPPPPKPCSTRNDCGSGQWCIMGQCKPRPFRQSCTPRRDCGDTGICVVVRNDPTVQGGMEILGRCEAGSLVPGAECMCMQY